MSPYPTQVTREQIIDTAWEMVEAGQDDLPLSKLAKALGIKAPSLYRHVKNKADLLKGINEHTETLLFEAINAVPLADDPHTRIMKIAHAYRAFAHAHPLTYMLAFTTIDPAARPDPAYQLKAVLTLQAVMAAISGNDDSLPALRGLLALIHGFVMLEINQQLRRGGDLDAAFTQSVQAYLRGWARE